MCHAIFSTTVKVLIAVTLMVLVAPPANAADRYWDNNSGSMFPFYTDVTFWSTDPALTMPAPAAPVAGDNIFFLFNAAPYSVILSAGNAAANFTASDGDATFTGPGGTLATSGVATIDDPFAAGLADGALVTLSGPNWTSAGDARIGDVGFGTLTVNSGSDLNARQFVIGNQSGSTGEVTVTGTGSLLNATLNSNVSLYAIGTNGGTGTLHVLAGAHVTTTSTIQGDISIGEGTGSTGTLNIDGAGSNAESEDVNVGYGGTGALNITNGGSMVLTDAAATTRNLTIALTLGGIGAGTVSVAGDNSLLSVGTISLGHTGAGTATVSAGGRINVVSGSNAVIGNLAGSSGGLTVTGVGSLADSTFAVTGNLLVGGFGQGTLRAELGGNVTVSTDLVIGDDVTNTNDNSVTIIGGGSLLTVGNRLVVGNEGVGNNTPGSETTNSLSITDGATASAAFLRVAEIAGSKGEMLVDGAGTTFSTTTNDAVVGTAGTGALQVSGGAVLTTASTFFAGYSGAGNGTVIVTGAGSQLAVNGNNSSSTFIGGYTGAAGGTGSVTIENGGFMNTRQNVYLGGNTTGDGSLTVTGAGSRVDSDDGLANETTYVGYANRGTLTIADGASVDSELVRIGELATVANGEAVATVTGVNGTASTWNVSGNVLVGNAGVGRLSITAGGRLISNSAGIAALTAIGNGATSDGSSVLIDGAGSNWTHTGSDFSVAFSGGDVANPVTLTIQNGGSLNVARILIADSTGSRGIATVTGTNSRLDASTNIFVGDQAVGFLNVTAGGVAEAQNAIEVGGFAAGNGTVLVDGAGSRLVSGGYLSLGDSSATSAAVGLLTIQNGGTVDTGANAFVGRFTFGNGTAHVNNGGTWNVATSMYVAGDVATASAGAGTGTLNIDAGGRVNITDTLKVWNKGVVNFDGGALGTLELTTLTRVAGSTFAFQSGKLSFSNNAANNRVFDAAALDDIFNADHTIKAGQILETLGPVTLSAPLRVNGGTLSVASVKPGSEAAFASNLDFDAGTLELTGQGLTISPAGPLGDTVSIVPGQTLTVSGGGLINNGSLNVIGAAASFTGAASTNNVGAEINAINATLDFTPGLTNNGVINLINTTIAGSVNSAAGSAASYVGDNSVGGDLVMAPADLLQIRIGGTGAGQYDTLAVSGAATLDGTLAVSLSGGFMPMLGDQFAVVTFASRTGDFDAYTGLALGGHLVLKPTFTASSLVLKPLPAIDGDINLDGTVDIFDINSVSANWNTAGPAGDANGDGIVNIFDINLISSNWGATGGSATAVPEPSAWLLAVIGLMVAAAAAARRFY
jgi:fibronectin-binding autotransporter adhesin